MKAKNLVLIAIGSFLSFNTSSFAETATQFNNRLLTIHSIDTADMPGAYQDVTFEYTTQNQWHLLEFKNGHLLPPTSDTSTLGIEKIELIQTETFPVQVFLKVTAKLFSVCGKLGQIKKQLTANRFEVFIFERNDAFSCISVAGTTSFNPIIPLAVYGLKAGEYEYQVNYHFAGSFSLSEDNYFK